MAVRGTDFFLYVVSDMDRMLVQVDRGQHISSNRTTAVVFGPQSASNPRNHFGSNAFRVDVTCHDAAVVGPT